LVRVSIFPIVRKPVILLQLFCRQCFAVFCPKETDLLFLPRLVQNGQSKEAHNKLPPLAQVFQIGLPVIMKNQRPAGIYDFFVIIARAWHSSTRR
jgi:hypothetical protein